MTENKKQGPVFKYGEYLGGVKNQFVKNEIDIFPDNPLNVRIKTAGIEIYGLRF